MTDFLLILGAAFVGGLFLFSGIMKLVSFSSTVESIPVPFDVANSVRKFLVGCLILIELSTGIAILVPPLRGFGMLFAISLLLAFALLGGAYVFQGKQPLCSCFGTLSSDSRMSITMVIRNLILVLIVAMLIANSKSKLQGAGFLWGFLNHTTSVTGLLFLAFSLVVIIAILLVYVQIQKLRATIDNLSRVERFVDDLPQQTVKRDFLLDCELVDSKGETSKVSNLFEKHDTRNSVCIYLTVSGCDRCDELVESIFSNERSFREVGGFQIRYRNAAGTLVPKDWDYRDDALCIKNHLGIELLPAVVVIDKDLRILDSGIGPRDVWSTLLTYRNGSTKADDFID